MQQHLCIAQATAKELQCLVDYFAQLRPNRWQEWERKYKDLSMAQYVFLIMHAKVILCVFTEKRGALYTNREPIVWTRAETNQATAVV